MNWLDQRSKTPVESRNYDVLYIVFSGLLFAATVWAVWDEVQTRRPWKAYQQEYHARLAAKLDSASLSAFGEIDSSRLASLYGDLRHATDAEQSDEYRKAVQDRERLARDLEVATREWRFARSRSDAAYYELKKGQEEGKDTVALRAELAKHDRDIATYLKKKTDIEDRVAAIDSIANRYKDVIQRTQADIRSVVAKGSALAGKADKMRSAPVGVAQVVLTDFEVTPFQEVKARVDRCQTCHAGWKDDLLSDAPQPFTKHPFPELLARHKPETFGCTPCHRGQGPALTAGDAHGDGDQYWETPILRGADAYATCNSCHYDETVLKYAKPLTRAKQLIIDSGCYGCHEVKGFTDLVKIGPQLNALPSKTQPEWVFRWVRNPKEYNPHTRMPNFVFDDEQAEAITAYLMKIGKESSYRAVRPKGTFLGGNSIQGKKIFESVGCQGCHTVAGFTAVRDARGTSYDMAPELSRVGSKVNGEWLFEWLKNPRHFNSETRMPSLRLTDGEAKDLVAYLMTLKDDKTYPPTPLRLDDPAVVDRGDKLIREYGCAGCHSIKGMEKEGKVSVELSDFGRKKVEQMDFGDTKELPKSDSSDVRLNADGTVAVKHTWRGWVYGKLRNSRQYVTERIAQKMPVFRFSDEEIQLIRLFLTSMTKDVPLAKYQHQFDKRMQDIEGGRRLTMKYNCIQCHNLEDRGAYVLAKYEEPAMGPPMIPESQGSKVQENWLHAFLQNPSTIRPWLQIRMPTFSLTDEEIAKIQHYFLGMSGQEWVMHDYASIPPDPAYLSAGKKLFETYQCGKCHPSGPVGPGASASDLAPNLMIAHERLKPDWILDWLHDPQKLQPGTRMPTFFTDGQGPDPSVYGGNADEQIKALRAYVWSLGRRGPARAENQ